MGGYKWERSCEYPRRPCGRREDIPDCGVKLAAEESAEGILTR